MSDGKLITTNDQIITRNIGNEDGNSFTDKQFQFTWSKHFKQWFTQIPYAMDDDTEAKQRAALCTYIDSSTFKLLCSLCVP